MSACGSESARSVDALETANPELLLILAKFALRHIFIIQLGTFTRQDAWERYHLSEEKLEPRTLALAKHGISGFRSTKVQLYQISC